MHIYAHLVHHMPLPISDMVQIPPNWAYFGTSQIPWGRLRARVDIYIETPPEVVREREAPRVPEREEAGFIGESKGIGGLQIGKLRG